MTNVTLTAGTTRLFVKQRPSGADFGLAAGETGTGVLSDDPTKSIEIDNKADAVGSVDVTAPVDEDVRWSYTRTGPWTTIPLGTTATMQIAKDQFVYVARV